MIQPKMKHDATPSLRVLFHCVHFDRNEFSFRVTKDNVKTTRNETI